MRNDLLKVCKHTIVYGLGKSSQQIAGFLLLPLYTRFLTPNDYGILSLVNFFTGFAAVIFVLGTSSSVFRFYRTSDDIRQREEACYSSIILVSVWSFIILAILFPLRNSISVLLFDTAEYGSYVMIGLCATAFTGISSLPMFILRAEERSGLFVVNNMISMLLRVGLGITFVVILKRAALGALEASLITALLFTIYLLFYRIRKTDFAFSLQILMKILKYGSPLIVSGFGWMVMSASDKYFLKEYSNLEQVGIYSIGYTLGYGVMIIVGAFRNAWPQMMFAYGDKEDAGIFYGKTLTYYIGIMGLIWLGVTLFSKEIVMLMTAEKFWDAYRVIPLVMLAYIFLGAGSITSAGIYTKDKTYNELILTPITACLCLVFNFIFISQWGMIGAAWATLFSFLFQFVIYTLIAKKYVIIYYQWSKLMRIISLIAIIAFLPYLIPDFKLWINILIKLSFFCTALFILYTPYYFHNELIVLINATLKK